MFQKTLICGVKGIEEVGRESDEWRGLCVVSETGCE